MRYTVNGRQIRESTESSDEKIAELTLKQVQVDIHSGKWFGKVKKVRTPLPEAIKQFLAAMKHRNVSWVYDEIMLRKFSEWAEIDTVLQEVDRPMIERFQTHLLAKGLSKSRVNRYIASLKSFFYRHLEWGNVQKNPAKGVKMFPEAMRVRYLELGQIELLVDHCSERLKPIVLVALLTGLRKGDILKLRWNDIDIENRKVHLLQGKTKNPLVVSMSEALVSVLKAIPVYLDSPHVFNDDGKRLTRFGWLRADFIKAVEAAGIKDFTFHDLRHTFATHQRFLGKDITVIKELLGHRTTKMTERYAHIRPDELKEANDALGEKIRGKLAQKKHTDGFAGEHTEVVQSNFSLLNKSD